MLPGEARSSRGRRTAPAILMLILLGWPIHAGTAEEAAVISPRLEGLRLAVTRGDAGALERFWEEVRRDGACALSRRREPLR